MFGFDSEGAVSDAGSAGGPTMGELLERAPEAHPDSLLLELSTALREAKFRADVCEMRGYRLRAWWARRSVAKAQRSLARQVRASVAWPGSEARPIEPAATRFAKDVYDALEREAVDPNSNGFARDDTTLDGAFEARPVGSDVGAASATERPGEDSPGGLPVAEPQSEASEPWFVVTKSEPKVSQLLAAESGLVERISAYSASVAGAEGPIRRA
jgi:hypothetical protein